MLDQEKLENLRCAALANDWQQIGDLSLEIVLEARGNADECRAEILARCVWSHDLEKVRHFTRQFLEEDWGPHCLAS